MIIKIQNEEGIIVLNNTDSFLIKEYGKRMAIYAYNGCPDTKVWLGYYSDIDKAKKVISRICEQYQYCQECKYGFVGIDQPSFVFKMPLDNEV